MNLPSATDTDAYQISMCYSYWKANTHNETTTFEMFFRKCPFGGEYAIVGGVFEAVEFIKNFHFTDEEINELKKLYVENGFHEKEFYDYLLTLNIKNLTVRGIPDGSVVFPNEPILQLTGPKILCQLLETTILFLTGHPTLITTYAKRLDLQTKNNQKLVEFGLRRAQGLSAGINSSKYSYIGGFIGTSNVRAGIKNNISVVGTIAHAYIMTFKNLDDTKNNLQIKNLLTNEIINDFKLFVITTNSINISTLKTNNGELSAFITYAWTQPNNFLALIDTYDTLQSGLINYCFVANALTKLGYKPKGIRIDSGDLAYLSIEIRKVFNKMKDYYPEYSDMIIVASNDLNETVIKSLNEQNCEIDIFGIGTKLSTCYDCPALGMVYKLTEINNTPRIKISSGKTTIPYKKYLFRLYNSDNVPVLDLMTTKSNITDYIDKDGNIFCVNPKNQLEFVKVKYVRHEEILVDLLTGGQTCFNPLMICPRERCTDQIKSMRNDHLRMLNPTPYKVSIPKEFSELIQDLIYKESVIKVI